MATEHFSADPLAHSLAPRARRVYLRAGLLFACVFAAGVTLAAVVAPGLQGFDRWVVLSMGSALATAATAFIMLTTFLLDVRT